MKKIRLLTSIIGFSSIFATTIGLSSCGQNNKIDYYLNESFIYEVEGAGRQALRSKDKISTKKKNISIGIDTSLLAKEIDAYPDEACFCIADNLIYDESQQIVPINDATIYANTKKLQQIERTSDFTGPFQYRITVRGIIHFSQGTLNNFPKITINLVPKDEIEQDYLIFWLSSTN